MYAQLKVAPAHYLSWKLSRRLRLDILMNVPAPGLVESYQVATDSDSHVLPQAVDIDNELDALLDQELSNVQRAAWELPDDVFIVEPVLPSADTWYMHIAHDYGTLSYQNQGGRDQILPDANWDPLDDNFHPKSYFHPASDRDTRINHYGTSSHQGQEAQGETRPGLKRKGSAGGVRDETRKTKKTSTTSEPLQNIATENRLMNGHAREESQPTEREIVEYMGNNPSKKPYMIANDLAPLEPLGQRRILDIVKLRLRTHTTLMEDRLIFKYYAENLHLRQRDMVKALCKALPRLNESWVQVIVEYLDHFWGDFKKPGELRLPGLDEIHQDLKPWRRSRSLNRSITEEQIVAVIQFWKEHQRMNQVEIVRLISKRLDVMQAPILKIVKHARQYKGNWRDYVPPSVEEINGTAKNESISPNTSLNEVAR
ncbi:hypothetical protein FRB93_002137 [Tulasnella sp. JGI-2019a]|nr:hypothetical protein FRB93_002137 [Tulasnella sp. JGI-2019a]